MAYFAKINDNNIVVNVIRVHDNELLVDGTESEAQGINFLNATYKVDNVNWKQTSYNTHSGVHLLGGTPFRKNHAGPGNTYDEERDAFIKRKPYDSWVLDEATCKWEPPIPYPDEGVFPFPDKKYEWNEEITNWEEVVTQ